MKVDHPGGIGNLGPLGGAGRQEGPEKVRRDRDAARAPEGGAVETPELSTLGRTIAEARRAADTIPDVRADRVARARARLETGYYDRPEVRDALVERLARLLRG